MNHRILLHAACLLSSGLLPLAGTAADEIHSFPSTQELPEGNYNVTVRFGSAEAPTRNWVKAESRRLMLDRIVTAKGEFVSRTFTVNIRCPEFKGGRVGLKKNETSAPRWDKNLTLEIFSTQKTVTPPEIAPAPEAVTVFLAGDSTVTDQSTEPWASWGLMLPAFFQEGVAVANHAESGLALTSFRSQRRLDKVFSAMKPGDYLLIQFGHNDQKDKRKGAGPHTTYKQDLEDFIKHTRQHQGIPVLVTPMERRRFDDQNKPVETLGEFAKAVRQVAKEQQVPVIDLHEMSLKLYAALGPSKSTKAFVFYPAGTFPKQSKALKDNTHHNVYGGYELAKCVVEGIRSQVPELAKRLRPGLPTFDPASPDAEADIPPSGLSSVTKPDGN